MAITTYSGLKTAIAAWIARSDIDEFIPDFVTLAEGHINARVRHGKMLATATLTPVAGVYALPADYLQYRRIVMDNGSRYVLKYVTPDNADQTFSSSASSIPCAFTIIGATMRVYPPVEANIEMLYWAKVPALSDVSPTNWLLDERPEVYLRLGCAFAAEFIKSDGEAQKQFALADGIFSQITNVDDLANYSRVGLTSSGVRP